MHQHNTLSKSLTSILAGLLAGVMVLTAPAVSWAVNRTDIDAIRNKNILADEDTQTLAKFVSEQFDQIARAETQQAVSDTVDSLIQINASNVPINSPTRQIYSDAYSKSLKENYPRCIEALGQLTDKNQLVQRKMSVAVVVASADNALLIEDLLTWLNDPLAEIRHWAAKGLTLPTVRTKLLAATRDDETLKKTYDALQSAAEKEPQGGVLLLIATAGILPSSQETAHLLKTCAANRLARYQAWPVNLDENMDMRLLQIILSFVGDSLMDNNELRTSTLVVAADLYAAAYQRYFKATQYKVDEATFMNLLPQQSLDHLKNVLIDGERNFLRLANSPRRGRMPNAIQRPPQLAGPELETIFAGLLGPEGDVNQSFKFLADGQEFTKLPEPPDTLITRAKSLINVKTTK